MLLPNQLIKPPRPHSDSQRRIRSWDLGGAALLCLEQSIVHCG